MKPVAEKGQWELRKGTDNFTDETSCVIVYKGNAKVQISGSTLYFSGGKGNGGLEGYRLRFDDNPPEDLRLANRIEKEIGTAIIEGPEFHRAITGDRVRFQGVGILSGRGFEHDVKMAGATEIMSDWRANGCPAGG